MPRALVPIKMPAKAVLQRTRGFLELDLMLEDDVIESMREEESLESHINDSQWDNLERLATETRTQYIVDILLTRNEDAIQRFVAALGKHIHTARFSDMLRYEILNERGELKPDNIKMEEGAMIVHREFGTSRRLSQYEKKHIQRIIAQKTQIYDRMFKREVQRLNRCIEEEKAKAEQKELYAKELAAKLKHFFQDHSAKLREFKEDGSYDDDYNTHRDWHPDMNILEGDIMGTMAFAKAALEEMDAHREEKERCVNALGEFSHDHKAPLDDQIQEALDQCSKALLAQRNASTARDVDVNDLSYNMDGLKAKADQERIDREKKIAALKEELANVSEDLKKWAAETARMRNAMSSSTEELEDWSRKLELVDRGKRLKQIHNRDGYTLEGDLANLAEGLIQDIKVQKAIEKAPENLGPVVSTRRYNDSRNSQEEGSRRSNGYNSRDEESLRRSNGYSSRAEEYHRRSNSYNSRDEEGHRRANGYSSRDEDGFRRSNGYSSRDGYGRQSSRSGHSSVSTISNGSSGGLSRRSTQSLPRLAKRANGFVGSLDDSDRFE